MDEYVIVIGVIGGCFLVAVFVVGSTLLKDRNGRTSKSLSPKRRYALAPVTSYDLKRQSAPIIRQTDDKSRSLAKSECLKLYSDDYRSDADVHVLNFEALSLEDKNDHTGFEKKAESLLNEAWNIQGEPDAIFAKAFGVSIRRKDLLSLRPFEWLNDEVINFYMSLICERSRRKPSLPSAYAFNTFFYPTLVKKGYANVKEWTKKVDIFSYDLLFIPIHLINHWCLVVVDLRQKCAMFYDSYMNDDGGCLKTIMEYLTLEMKQKKGQDLDVNQWNVFCRKNIPQQFNGSDCGVFCSKFADYTARRARIDFDHSRMTYFRKRMVYEICNQKLDE
ncbi:sentrin-specific protease [Ditylenchus destructor]|uniref:Sentrin-specific protease n=1 Tax=Ditylenchus destructor TaxID=166010 RepID=A0AAD4MRC5_9BILA|nr:sentrin-specific protease [Ditylenchus destructor]